MFEAPFLWQPWCYNRQHSFFVISTPFLIHTHLHNHYGWVHPISKELQNHSNSTILPFPNDSLHGVMVAKYHSSVKVPKRLFTVHQTKWTKILVFWVLYYLSSLGRFNFISHYSPQQSTLYHPPTGMFLLNTASWLCLFPPSHASPSRSVPFVK